MSYRAARLSLDRRRRAAAIGGSPFSAEANQFFVRVSDPGTTRKGLYANLIDALVTAGVWAKLDALYLLAAADAATALTNLVQSSYGATAINAPTFTADHGYAGAGTKCLDTGFSPATAVAPQFTQNSAVCFAWGLTSGQSVGPIFGQRAGITTFIFPRFVDDTAFARLNSSGEQVVASTDARGFWLGVRRASNDQRLFKNGSEVASGASASSAVTDDNLAILMGFGSAAYAGDAGLAGFGSKLTDGEITALYNAAHTYMQTVAGVA